MPAQPAGGDAHPVDDDGADADQQGGRQDGDGGHGNGLARFDRRHAIRSRMEFFQPVENHKKSTASTRQEMTQAHPTQRATRRFGRDRPSQVQSHSKKTPMP